MASHPRGARGLMSPLNAMRLEELLMMSSSWRSSRNFSQLIKVLWLSDNITEGIPFTAARRSRQRMKDFVVRLSTTSRWTALVVMQTNKQMYSLMRWPWAYRSCYCTLSAGSGGNIGLTMALALCLWQVTHLRSRDFTRVRVFGEQKDRRYTDKVCDTPQWKWVLCMCWTIRSTNLERLGMKRGVWASRGYSEWINLPWALMTLLMRCKFRSLMVFLTSMPTLILGLTRWE